MTRRRPLKVGLFLPHLEGAYEARTAGWDDLRAIATTAEDVGFDSVWVADHLLYRIPGIDPFGTWECWSMVSALAAVTSRVEIGTIVSVTPWRNPGLLAKIVDTAEEVSGGRDCELRPRGPRPEGPPIMVGAIGPRMLRATVAHADMWNIPWRHELADVVSETARGEAACREAGRDPATLARSVCLQVDRKRPEGSSPGDLLEQGRPNALKLETGALADHLRSYADAGVSHVQLWLDPSTPEAVEGFADVLADLDGG